MACPPTSHTAECTACVCKVVSLFETTCRCDEQHSMTKSAKDSPHQQHVRTCETATDLMPWQQSKHANTQTQNKAAEQRAKQKILKPNTALHKQQWFSMFSATDCLLQRLCAPIAAMIIGCPSAGRHQVASRAGPTAYMHMPTQQQQEVTSACSSILKICTGITINAAVMHSTGHALTPCLIRCWRTQGQTLPNLADVPASQQSCQAWQKQCVQARHTQRGSQRSPISAGSYAGRCMQRLTPAAARLATQQALRHAPAKRMPRNKQRMG